MLRDYASTSFWLETTDDDLTPRPGLDGSVDVDVAILGAGYTGLWTAYYLLARDPSLKVAVVEREIAGFGASGRNGGWCSANFPVTAATLAERYGREAARDTFLALYDTVDEVGRVCAAEGIDAQFTKGGSLLLARGPHQLPALQAAHTAYSKLGLADHYHWLDSAQVAERVRVAGVVAGMFRPDCAIVHPSRLVRGLARAVERRGGTIYERTEVVDFETGSSPCLITRRGDVRARTIVLAGEAYLSRLRRLHRQLIPLYSLIVLTEPLGPERWAEIGWQNHEGLASLRLSVDYLSRTHDSRIAFGGRGEPYHFGSRIRDAYDRDAPTHALLRRMLAQWFPTLREVGFTHAWGGPLGMPRDWMPTMSYDRALGVATARGYTGQGVAMANLSGRVLTDLITGVDSPLTRLPMVGHRSPDWEPEPLRWLGIRYVQLGFHRLDNQAELTGRPPSGHSLAERLGRH
jgi:glycine/D-amino acid oxidase-like deaminating enzyme